jgi:hypothetical protein
MMILNKDNFMKHLTVKYLIVAVILGFITFVVKISGISGLILSLFINAPSE